MHLFGDAMEPLNEYHIECKAECEFHQLAQIKVFQYRDVKTGEIVNIYFCPFGGFGCNYLIELNKNDLTREELERIRKQAQEDVLKELDLLDESE